VQRTSFVLSILVHTLGLILILTGSIYLASHHNEIQQQVMEIFPSDSSLPMPVSKTRAGGGGGGGDRDKLAAPKGAAPRFAAEQLTPPAIVIRNPAPKLTAEPTVLGPPQLTLPQLAQLGDPLSRVLGPASNGTGSGGGIGSGAGTGVGSGHGAGVGPGSGGGAGGGVYQVGGGVSAPKLIYGPDPEFSEEARKSKYQGAVVLTVVVGADGRVHDMRVLRSLGLGLDEKAMEAVKNWRFEPSMTGGRPVPVEVNVEVDFHLY